MERPASIYEEFEHKDVSLNNWDAYQIPIRRYRHSKHMDAYNAKFGRDMIGRINTIEYSCIEATRLYKCGQCGRAMHNTFPFR